MIRKRQSHVRIILTMYQMWAIELLTGSSWQTESFIKFMVTHVLHTPIGTPNVYRVLNRRRHPAIDRRLLWDL